MKIIFTKHSERKIKERKIDKSLINDVILFPDFKKEDKYDAALIHKIKNINDKFLRVITKSEKDIIKVITAYYDRGLKSKRGGKK